MTKSTYKGGEVAHHGRIEVICGSMFSGKTEELIRRMRRAEFAHLNIMVFKPEIDNRYSIDNVVTHNGLSVESTIISNAEQIEKHAYEADVIGIDEAQFLDDNIIDICNRLANNGKRIIIAGLDLDYTGKPFGPMPNLCAIADEVTKVNAICVKCGSLAYISHRIIAAEGQVLIGETHEYEPLCRECYNKVTKKVACK